MESVEETPVKRRKIGDGDPSHLQSQSQSQSQSESKAFESGNDSGSDLFEDFETIATLPVAKKDAATETFVTQPTQIIGASSATKDEDDAVVQVAGSSPPSKPSPLPVRAMGGRLANLMAPPGTNFRPPPGISRAPIPKKEPIFDISSDEDELAKWRHNSSDEDTQTASRADIKPSSFVSSKTSGSVTDRFRNTIQNAVYKAPSIESQRPGSTSGQSMQDSRNQSSSTKQPYIDILASSYGSSAASRQKPRPRQAQPAKSTIPNDIDLDDIQDSSIRTKVRRLREMLPSISVNFCYNALIKKRGNFDDAAEYLLSASEKTGGIIVLSDDEPKAIDVPKKKPTAKQSLNAPHQKIHERWAASQSFINPNQSSQDWQGNEAMLPTLQQSNKQTAKPRRRLVQGRKPGSPPLVSSSPPPIRVPNKSTTQPKPKSASLDSDTVASDLTSGSDSGLGTEKDDMEPNGLLDFFNNCDPAQLIDLAGTSREDTDLIISQRPFKSIEAIRQIATVQTSDAKKKKKITNKVIGDRIVEKCYEMWNGYVAIDKLNEACDDLGSIVKSEMNKWGLNTLGALKDDGELELADLNTTNNDTADSGIGTPSSDEVDKTTATTAKQHGLFQQPSIIKTGFSLKDYQVVGINWLALLFDHQLSGILADDMGLGKTCQVVAFLAHLLEVKGVRGPHLIIVPSSTIENWLREFKEICPSLKVEVYYGSQKDRIGMRQNIKDSLKSLNVVVTSYTIAKGKEDNLFLRKDLKPTCTIYDEGHLLRNSQSAGYKQYVRIPCKFRLLLTGTPLQNNLVELASLLGFILPHVFAEYEADLAAIFNHKAKTTDNSESHAALLSMERIQRAKRMMAPFVLRRKKHQVLKHLPAKHCKVHYCELSAAQREIYEAEIARAFAVIEARAAGDKTNKETTNTIMTLRKASIHPLLSRRIYNNDLLTKMSRACLKEPIFRESNPTLVWEDMSVMTDMELHHLCEKYPDTMSSFRLRNDEWMDSGKVQALIDLLLKYQANGDRVLVFSQFVMVLNILEVVLEDIQMKYYRLDGNTKVHERQKLIDEFYEYQDVPVFLLSTGAGGAGINLACANRVIIFDSSFNPQSDIQAENRAHRVGQTREVEVVRLVTKGTVEEQIHLLGETKLKLDDRVAGVDNGDSVADAAKTEKQGEQRVWEMLMEQKVKTDNAGPEEPEKMEGVAVHSEE